MNIALLILLIGVCNVLSAPTTDTTGVKPAVDGGFNFDKVVARTTWRRPDGSLIYEHVQRIINDMMYTTTKTWNKATGQYDVVKQQRPAFSNLGAEPWVPCEKPCKV